MGFGRVEDWGPSLQSRKFVELGNFGLELERCEVSTGKSLRTRIVGRTAAS